MQVYNRIQAITDLGARRKAIKALSDTDKKAYTKYQSGLRQAKWRRNPENLDKLYAANKEHKKKQRQANPDKVRAIVREYVRKFRERHKQKQQARSLPSLDINDLIRRSRAS